MKDWEVHKNSNELASEQPWTHEVITDIALKKNFDAFDSRNIKQCRDNRLILKSKALLNILDQYSDEEDLYHPKEEIKLILHKYEEHQELHPQDKKQLIVSLMYWRSDEHNRLRAILNQKAGIQCPSRWSPYLKGKKKDSGTLKHVYPESEHSQYEELISFLFEKLSFLPDWA
ncbi:6952_t:CDS:2 [Dentiscutata erythropus]|uniref:6952_t:CDS:1 n=1 Tax=Dentiscutata erythropus TaxID=1348616 RepID=A0A9N9A9C5_9GLOM|nr:6952_t:CDS:2 [Dentiscutata erythropus]